jgi:hypothetical protein
MDLLLCRSPSSVSVSAAQTDTRIRGCAGGRLPLSVVQGVGISHMQRFMLHVFVRSLSPPGALRQREAALVHRYRILVEAHIAVCLGVALRRGRNRLHHPLPSFCGR